MYHAACKVEFQPFKRLLTADVFQLFIKFSSKSGTVEIVAANSSQAARSLTPFVYFARNGLSDTT